MSLLMVAPSIPAAGQEIMSGEAEIYDLDASRAGNSLNVAMSLDITALTVGGDETVILTPVIEKDDRSIDLPPVEIRGRRAYMHYLRNGEQPITDNAARTARSVRRWQRLGKEQRIDYSAAVPFERWMRGATLAIREESCGCDDTPLALGTTQVGRVLHTPYTPQFVISFVEPEPEPVKTREESFSAYINFKVDKHDILVDYKDNAAELAAITESVNRVGEDSDLTITSISIDGWASPEAPESYNLALSQRRADALAEYIADNTDTGDALITAKGHGEDWVNFRAYAVALPQLLDREKVLAIIDDGAMSLDEKDAALVKLIPPTIYHRLIGEIYPRLRRNDYRIVYNVRSFDVQEARAMLDSAPKKLSLSEMYLVAGLYEKGSAEYNHVMEVAARTYPTEVAAAVNAAAVMIEVGDYDGALALLEKAPSTAPVLNAQGLAYARRGDIGKAREAWTQAAQQASADAKHNLAELEKSME